MRWIISWWVVLKNVDVKCGQPKWNYLQIWTRTNRQKGCSIHIMQTFFLFLSLIWSWYAIIEASKMQKLVLFRPMHQLLWIVIWVFVLGISICNNLKIAIKHWIIIPALPCSSWHSSYLSPYNILLSLVSSFCILL